MKDEKMTKKQLIDELAKLRQENSKLKLAHKNQECVSRISDLSTPNRWFSTGRAEVVFPVRIEQQPSYNYPVKYRLSDLVDIPFLQQLLNSFYVATGIPHGLHDEDNNILSGNGWQDICTQFHRVCPQTECRCKQSDSYIADHLHEGPYVGYKCMNGLMDFGTPIIVEGQHIASIFLGQFLHNPPDEEFFRRQAQDFGFDEKAYIEALHRVPVIPEEQIESIMAFYSQLGQFLATMGLERKRQLEAADQTLRNHEKRLSLVLETSNDAFWDWNLETGELYYSPRWAEILGYSQEELEPHISTWDKLVHPDDIDAAMKIINEHLSGNLPKYEIEYRMLTKSGEWKWTMNHGQVVAWNEKGQPLRMSGAFVDITDRKKTKAALYQSEQKFYKAFHCNPDLMGITTLNEGRFIEVNDTFVKTIGYERHEIIGHTANEMGIWTFPEQRDIMVKRVQETGSIRGYEAVLRMKSGEIRNFSISAEIIDIDDKPHLLTTVRDITESRRMIEALRFSEECFSKAFNASPVLMAVTSLNEGKIIKVNNAFCRNLGYSQEELIDRTTFEIGFWADLSDRDIVQQMLMGKQSVHEIEIHFHRKTGEERLGLYSAEHLDVDGEPCILGVLVDITELRKMEVEMTRLDRLNLVGEMAASIGHEIRNPMTTVRGYLQILKENRVNDDEAEYFDLMIEELDRANSIITEFLSLAKNKMVDLQPRNLNEIINKLLPLIQAKALIMDHSINLELNEIPDLLLDKKEIRQLIFNLVDNGLESMASAGDITIKTFMDKNNAVLAVQDQGQGIDGELLDKLGTPFFTTKDKGTGLGLAVCYRIAARHNAKIDIDTSPTGTIFYVRFQ